MTYITTQNFGFTAVREQAPSANDWAATYQNWIKADTIMYGVLAHRHTGEAALDNPLGVLTLTQTPTGGTLLAGKTYYFVATYLDASGLETAISSEASITMPAGLDAPPTPTSTAGDIVAHAGGLSGGSYWYKISYLKAGGETASSNPVYISVPYDNTYEVTIHFDSLTTAANGADTIRVFRKISPSGAYVKIGDVTGTSTDNFTDDGSNTPYCDIGPSGTNTTNSLNTITIDCSTLTNIADANVIRIYVSTVSLSYSGTDCLVGEIDLSDATPGVTLDYTGQALSQGSPPAVSNTYPNPGKISLEEETTGYLPYENLPLDFSWGQPVQTVGELPTFEQDNIVDGMCVVVLDENALYQFEGGLATPAWTKILSWESGEFQGGIQNIVIPDSVGYQASNSSGGNFDTTVLPLMPDNPETGDIVSLINHEEFSPEHSINVVYLYMWRGDWATPAWQLISSLLPNTTEDTSYTNFAAPEGSMWMEKQGDWYNNQYLIKVQQAWNDQRIYAPCNAYMIDYYGGYYGPSFSEPGEGTPSNYGYGAVTFYWNDKSFYYWDDNIATPAWVKGPGVVKTGETVLDVAEDATPSKEQLKINEILEVLRASGLIEE